MASSSKKYLSRDVMNSFKDAVNKKDETRINELLSKENAQAQDNSGCTFLHIVAQEGMVETAIRLLELGSDVNVFNSSYENAISYAIENSARMVEILLKDYNRSIGFIICRALFYGSEEETVRLLVNKGLSDGFLEYTSQDTVSSGNSDEIQNTKEAIRVLLNSEYCDLCNENLYQHLILFAARFKRRDILELIFDHCKDKDDFPVQGINIQGSDSVTALHCTVMLQHLESVRFLLEEGADPNCMTDTDTIAPLHLAALFGNEEICQLLLSFGANPNLDNIKSPLYYVCGNDRIDVSFWDFIRRIVCWDFEYFHFLDVELRFNTKIMKLLLENGADPNHKLNFDTGEKSLHKVCKAGRLTDVKILLEFGANINDFDDDGNTALHHAVKGNSLEVAAFLLEKGSDIEKINNEEYSPLMLAALEYGFVNFKLIDFLVDQGANINSKGFSDVTFFRRMIEMNFTRVVEYLLELNVDWMIEIDNCFPTNFLKSQSSIEVFISFLVLKKYELSDFSISNNLLEISMCFEKSKKEVQKLKSTVIFKELSICYFDFLNKSLYSSAKLLKNSDIRQILSNGGFKKEFPSYRFLLEKRLQRIRTLENSIDRTYNFFLNYEKVQLPIIVIEMILGNLCSKDFRVFDKALS